MLGEEPRIEVDPVATEADAGIDHCLTDPLGIRRDAGNVAYFLAIEPGEPDGVLRRRSAQVIGIALPTRDRDPVQLDAVVVRCLARVLVRNGLILAQFAQLDIIRVGIKHHDGGSQVQEFLKHLPGEVRLTRAGLRDDGKMP